MRKIKFRGKSKTTNQWVYGYLVDCDTICRGTYREDEYDDATTFRDFVEVDPHTIGQYIGRKDRNGKEIYEGDIVKLNNGDICVIKYETMNGSAMFTATGVTKKYSSKFLLTYYPTAIVIGNIYENPELLEVKK